MWEKILDVLLNYGFLGIAAFVLIKNYQKKENQNQKNFQLLIENVIESNKENRNNVIELKEAINNLGKYLDGTNRNMEEILKNMSVEVDELKKQYGHLSERLVSLILNNREISERLFFDVVKVIVENTIYKSLISMNAYFDNNGLTTEEKICTLKQNIINDITRYREQACESITEIEFNKDKKEHFISSSQLIWDESFVKFEEEILNNITLESLKGDHNYFLIKQKIKNFIYCVRSEILKILAESLK